MIIPSDNPFIDDFVIVGTGRRNAFLTIEESCDKVVAQEIRIVRGSLFDWTGPDKNKPISCDALGAVLWCSGNAKVSSPWSTLCKLLRIRGRSLRS